MDIASSAIVIVIAGGKIFVNYGPTKYSWCYLHLGGHCTTIVCGIEIGAEISKNSLANPLTFWNNSVILPLL